MSIGKVSLRGKFGKEEIELEGQKDMIDSEIRIYVLYPLTLSYVQVHSSIKYVLHELKIILRVGKVLKNAS